MESSIVAWCVVGLLAFACLALYLRGRGFQSLAQESEVSQAASQKEARELRKQLERQGKKQESRGDDTAELRRRLDKAKKRAAQLVDEKKHEPGRIAALEQELADKVSELAVARQEIDDLGARIGKLEAAARALKAAPAVEAAPPATPAPESDALGEATRARDALRQELTAVTKELSKAKGEIEQTRGRIKTQDKLYLAIRGELAAKKDQLKRQREEIERLLAVRVTVMAVDAEGAAETELEDGAEAKVAEAATPEA